MDSASLNPPPMRQEQQPPGGSGDGAAATCILNTTQLRWQLVRAVEAFQNGEFENVELRREVMMLRSELKAEVERAKNEKPKVDYSEVAASLLKRVEPMKAEIKSIREQLCANVVSYNSDYFVKMNTLIKKLTLQNTTILAENKIILAENFELKSRADIDGSEMQQVAMELKTKNSEIAKLKKEVDKLKLGLQEYESNKSSSQQETGDLKRKIDELTLSLYDIVPKYDFSRSEVIRLTQQIAGFEMDSQSSYEAHILQQQNIISYYEKLVGELKCENADLNLVVHSQQEQIEKLTNSLLGNKSHFAKFVELKSENIQLQSKLTQIAKKVNNGAILGTGSLLGSNQNSLYSINNSVSSLSLLQNQVPKSHSHPQGGMHQMQPIAVPVDAISPKRSVVLALTTTKGGNLPSARESGRDRDRDREPMMSSNINDNNSMDDEIEKDLGEDTIKNRILKRREKKNQTSSNQNQNMDVNRHYNQNLQEPEPEFVGEIGMNSFADADYDDSDHVDHNLNVYSAASHQTNVSTTTKNSSSHNMPTGGKMINLSLIDDSNSVCDQLAKVEAFARMSPKKLLPKDAKTNSTYNNNNNNNSSSNTYSNNNTININNNGGYAPESTLSMSARSVISPRVPPALRPNNAYGSGCNTSITSMTSSSQYYHQQQQQSGGGSNVLKNGIAAGQVGHFTSGGGGGGGGGGGMMSMSGASMGSVVGSGDVKKITI